MPLSITLNRSVSAVFILSFSIAQLCFVQWTRGQIFLSVKGLTEWEQKQAQVSPRLAIDYLVPNSFIISRSIRKVSLFEWHVLDRNQDSLLADVWHYNKAGELKTHEHEFELNQNHNLEPSLTRRYLYNADGYLISIQDSVAMLVDPSDHVIPCPAYPDTIVFVFNSQKGLVEKSSLENGISCLEVYRLNQENLISSIEMFVNGTLARVETFVYEFWHD